MGDPVGSRNIASTQAAYFSGADAAGGQRSPSIRDGNTDTVSQPVPNPAPASQENGQGTTENGTTDQATVVANNAQGGGIQEGGAQLNHTGAGGQTGDGGDFPSGGDLGLGEGGIGARHFGSEFGAGGRAGFGGWPTHQGALNLNPWGGPEPWRAAPAPSPLFAPAPYLPPPGGQLSAHTNANVPGLPPVQGTPHALPGQGAPNTLPGQAIPQPLPGQGTNPNALPPTPVNPNALPGRPMAGVPPVGPMPPNPALPHAQVLPVPAQAGGLAQAGVNGVLLRAPPAPPLPVAQAVANPQAMAAAAALGRAVQGAQAAQAALAAQMAQAGQQGQQGQQATLAGRAVLAGPNNGVVPLPGLGGRGVLTAQQAQAQTVWAQQVLAQALGRLAAGQMGAGAAALALAQGQLALREGRLALTQAAVQGQLAVQGQGRGQPLGAGKAAVDGQLLPPGQVPVAMPRVLAQALALAPKRRKRGTYDRVEAVDRHTPRQQAPEMEDEDFWDGVDEDADGAGGGGGAAGLGQGWSEGTEDADARRQVAQAQVQHYRAVHAWLRAHGQQVLLRELAAGRRVMVLAPPDQSHQRLIGHLLRPDAARPDRVTAPGTTGRAWALAARWSATLPADPHWRQWRVRQAVSATGEWCIETSQPNRYTPRLAASESRVPAGTAVGEAITLLDPRRLRRLTGSQWTLAVLRVPVPLDAGGTAG